MRSHAKASSAGSTKGNGRGLGGLIVALALVACALSCMAAPAGAAPLRAVMGSVSNVSYATADVTAEVDANGWSELFFEVSTDGLHWATKAEGVSFSESLAPVSAELKGLRGGTKYLVRLRAAEPVGNQGVAISPEPSAEFTTLPVDSPTVLSVANATDIFSTTAATAGQIERPSTNSDPAFDTKCRFEFISDAEFLENEANGDPLFEGAGSNVCSPSEITAADSPGPTPVAGELKGLAPSTTYHLRLVAENAGPLAAKEAASTFTTLPAVDPPSIVSFAGASEVEYTRAKVSGIVERAAGTDPALETECRFEYISDAQAAGNEANSLSPFEGASQAPCVPTAIPGGVVTPVSASLSGLSVATTYRLRLNVTNGAGTVSEESTFSTQAVPPPGVVFEDPVVDTPIEAHFNFQINPGGTDPALKVHWFFFCSPECPGVEGDVPADGVNHQLSVPVKVKPNTAYEIFLYAESVGGGFEYGGSKNFTTFISVPPTALTTGAATASSSATLYGKVNPLGNLTDYYFEYGADINYGSRIPVDRDVVVGAGFDPVSVSQDIGGLTAGTYHYRLVAESSADKAIGVDRSFTTAASGGPQRAYELVSPAEKNGKGVKQAEKILASADGNAISYKGGYAVLPGLSTQTAPFFPQYVAFRAPSGWSNHAVELPQNEIERPNGELPGYSFRSRATIALSHDGTKALVGSNRALAPGAIENGGNFYLEDTQTGALQTVAAQPDPAFWTSLLGLPAENVGEGKNPFAGGTENFDHLLFYAAGFLGSDVSLLPGVPRRAIYDFTGGSLKVASIGPKGEYLPGRPTGFTDREKHWISADGSRIFFESPLNHAGGLNFEEPAAVYVRIDGERTQVLTESHRAGEEGMVLAGKFAGASRDGSIAYVFAKGLTNDLDPNETYLYRYAVATEQLEALTRVGSVALEYQVSADGETIYFESRADLVGSPSRDENIYVWRRGALSLVASLSSKDVTITTGGFTTWASSNGRYLMFTSRTNGLTDYNASAPGVCADNANEYDDGIHCKQAYRYDADSGELTCASCPPDGRPATGNVYAGAAKDEYASNEGMARAATNKGQVFFDTPDKLLAADTNGARDVYEYDGSTVRLVSSGQGRGSRIAAVAADGDDVFFTTANRLVRGDFDEAVDLYDARVGGGIASQNAGPQVTECTGEDCRGLPPVPPSPPPGGSETSFGPGSESARKKARCSKRRKARASKAKQRCAKPKKAEKSHKAKKNRRQGR